MRSGTQVKQETKKNVSNDASLLIAALSSFYPLSSAVENYFQEHIQPFSFRRGKLLLKTGEVCRYVYFIKKGAVRGFIKEKNKDITTWITAENEMVTSISGLDSDEPAIENIQAIEDCEMIGISYDDLKKLYVQHPEFNVVSRKLLQQYYRDAEGRAFIARLTNAENKYKYFLTKYNHLVNRIPLKYIASFLGITLETLSRIRKKMSERN